MVKIEKEREAMEKVLFTMWEKAIHMHEKVLPMLKEKNKDIALEIMKEDDFMNHLEEEVNLLALNVLALLSPVASDLRYVISTIKIASELERIGDYAKNIGMWILKNSMVEAHVLEYAQEMEMIIIEMLKQTKIGYEKQDMEIVFSIPQQDKRVNHLEKEWNATLHTYTDIEKLKQVLSIAPMLRNVERAGDHTKNICEHIIYLVKGQYYDFG
ncbi:MAG: phosphate signaling complex protein PhoU [Erysipelotrichaceae bacterium]|nr:phosphate signaling complex protein PhoU [Erysipelotrichaceae bacterium]